MQVPQALLDERARMERVIDDEDSKIKLLQGSLAVTRARYEGLDTAIALIEGAEDRAVYERVVAPPPEIEHEGPVPGRHAPGREPRSPRRNIKELVAGELRLANADGLVDRGIAELIDALLPQVRAALSKLADEGKAHYASQTDRWCWGTHKVIRKVPQAPPDAIEAPAPAEPAAAETTEPVSSGPPQAVVSLVVYLGGRPEGRALTELCEVGYREADVRDAEVAGAIWLDARGFYHAAIGAAGGNLEAAQ